LEHKTCGPSRDFNGIVSNSRKACGLFWHWHQWLSKIASHNNSNRKITSHNGSNSKREKNLSGQTSSVMLASPVCSAKIISFLDQSFSVHANDISTRHLMQNLVKLATLGKIN